MRVLAAAAAVMFLLQAGCGSDDGGDGASVDGAWARTSPMMADAGAAYMDITADADAELVGVSVDSEVAVTAELHETVRVKVGEMADDEMADDDMADDEMADDGEMADEEMADDGEMAGTMTMQEVTSISLPAGETVSLEPGGYHVMLLELAEPLELGATFEVTLEFDTGDDMVVEVEVRDEAP